MKGKCILKNGTIIRLSPNETMQLSRLLTPLQRETLNEGDNILVKVEYLLDSWKEYWVGREIEED